MRQLLYGNSLWGIIRTAACPWDFLGRHITFMCCNSWRRSSPLIQPCNVGFRWAYLMLIKWVRPQYEGKSTTHLEGKRVYYQSSRWKSADRLGRQNQKHAHCETAMLLVGGPWATLQRVEAKGSRWSDNIVNYGNIRNFRLCPCPS